MKTNTSKRFISTSTIGLAMLLVLAGNVRAQVNSGSNGSDGTFNPTTSTNIDMNARPNGIYQYTSVNIPTNVTVTFTPNANNTPVVWLVQTNCVISGTVNVAGQSGSATVAGQGGPGGFCGGNRGSGGTSGQGPGAGGFGKDDGGPASYGTLGKTNIGVGASYGAIGSIYGNIFLIPLLGGSGGGGSSNDYAGCGGGGALLIAASGTIQLDGKIHAEGGQPATFREGGGSGGAVRLVASTISGKGQVYAAGGLGEYTSAGNGRVRFDTYLNNFAGTVDIGYSQGTQFIVIPNSGQGTQLTITSVGGVPVSASPTGIITTPDAVISALQSNPISIAVQCANIPLNTQITVTVTPVNGLPVSATGYNNTGTLASSTATVLITMPRGGGFISASAATGN